MIKSALLAALAAMTAIACSKGGDDCQKVADRSGALFSKLPEDKRVEAKTKFLEECRKPDSKMKRDPVFLCMRDAADDQAATACMTKGFDDYKAKSQQAEAKVKLTALGRSLKVAHEANAAFPAGTAPLSPAEPCCKGPDKKCPAGTFESWASSSKVWADLDFAVLAPHSFQYSYQSDGTTATATAVGDLDCDGQTITFTLTAKVENGEVKTAVEGPAGTD